jgi:hypothetical protein
MEKSMTNDTVNLLAVVAIVAASMSAFFLPWAFWRWVLYRKTVENPNWELEDEIRNCLNWAQGLQRRSGFGELLEESRLELLTAIAAARVALAPESKIGEAWVLRAIHTRLKAAGKCIAQVLPPAYSNDYNCMIGFG